ncbi:hypothetical protein [Streptomyces sp. B21-083]
MVEQLPRGLFGKVEQRRQAWDETCLQSVGFTSASPAARSVSMCSTA